MKILNLVSIILSIGLIFSLASCTQESEIDGQNEVNSFKIIPISDTKSEIYTDNYKVSNQTSSIDIANDVVNIEIPVPKNDYQLIRVYNISSDNNAAILYLIGRNKTNEVVDKPIQYVVQDNVSISGVGLDTNLLQNGNGLRIFVMNNIQELDTDAAIFNCIVNKVESNIINGGNCSGEDKAADGPHTDQDGFII